MNDSFTRNGDSKFMDLCSVMHVEGIISVNRTLQDCLFLTP